MKNIQAATVAVCLAFSPLPTLAYDNFPGDSVWAGDGTHASLIYFAHQNSKQLRVQGHGKMKDSRLTVNSLILRDVHYTEIAGEKFLYQAFLPIGDISTARSSGHDQDTRSGVGDLTFEVAWFPFTSTSPTGTSMALGLYLGTPTGNYDVDEPSIGSGTWSVTTEAGIVQGLGAGFFLDSTVSSTFSKTRRHEGIEVRSNTAYQGQFYLRHQFSPTAYWGAGVSTLQGGKGYLDGNYTGIKTRSDQFRLFANKLFYEHFMAGLMVGRDFHADGGYRKDSQVTLRFARFW
ncbi:hypothetical protein CCOS865_03263 [Pseudomonas reidholzensis]|uniref:Transporter n=1 Tax=Pseudomonas reidholzensis TaxID=1785162 RepID=A0A383RWF4_9PSED|nr:transporter [Pseudomonas reidholzensis]SYX90994.1 hypothetical protein CCOS865_03263 [Pseudomonas reidholzensis]